MRADALSSAGSGPSPSTSASVIAQQFLKEKEGFVRHTYDDADPRARPLLPGQRCRGTPTIGYGHTGRFARPGATIDVEEAQRILEADMAPVEGALRQQVTPGVLARLDPYQQAALIAFVFNVGAAAFAKSTLRRKLNQGDLEAFVTEAPKWNKATIDGRKVTLDGLVTRRAEEVLLWQTPATPEDEEEAMLALAGAVPAAPRPLAQSLTVQGLSMAGAATGVGLVLQLLSGLAPLPVPVQLALIGTTGATVLGLGIAFRGRLRLRQLENV